MGYETKIKKDGGFIYVKGEKALKSSRETARLIQLKA